MNENKLISANKAFRKGLWQVRIWPLVVMILTFGGLIYATLELGVPVSWAIASFLSVVFACAIWSLRRIGVWKSWMAANTVNPKTALEMAKASFLKQQWKENLAIWGKAKKEAYRQNFDARMAAVKESYLKDAKERYAEKKAGHCPLSIFRIALDVVVRSNCVNRIVIALYLPARCNV